ncbi:hypothetical protein [Vitiosangium sp. GDMCC 1.1324]|uniref:hypothetical protein n=1 Tax=Vitiosangium sp. (strain GDMCC 1.1324) TaxID=2138576 RepID=UPI000D3368E3|nr:hypothetical protein [Vitiosangium sp. GDMCC 1.1324]PTL84362.1 hypothetical protein DAT35_04500 [Vitiosangium sp. GDMCC 1.1324]
MTSTLLALLLLSQEEGPDSPPAGMEPPLSGSPARSWRYLARLEASGLALLLVLALLSNACVSLPPPPGHGGSLRYAPYEATRPVVAGEPGEESPLALASWPPSPPSWRSSRSK